MCASFTPSRSPLTSVRTFLGSPNVSRFWSIPGWCWCTGWLELYPEGRYVTLFAAITAHFGPSAPPWTATETATVNLDHNFLLFFYHTSPLCCSCISVCILISLVRFTLEPVHFCHQTSHFSEHVSVRFLTLPWPKLTPPTPHKSAFIPQAEPTSSYLCSSLSNLFRYFAWPKGTHYKHKGKGIVRRKCLLIGTPSQRSHYLMLADFCVYTLTC